MLENKPSPFQSREKIEVDRKKRISLLAFIFFFRHVTVNKYKHYKPLY